MIRSSENSKSASWFCLPSLPVFFGILFFILVSCFKGQFMLGDGGTGVHVRAGEFILSTSKIPQADPFSFFVPPLPWTAHEWLSEVIMALVHRVGGLTGVVIFFCLLLSVIYASLFGYLYRRFHYFTAVLFIFLAMFASSFHWLARPHVFTYFFFIFFYFILDAYESGQKNRLWLLPFLMLFWVNLHGGFVVGLAILGIYLLKNAVTGLAARGNDPVSRHKAKILFFTLGACVLAGMINPRGPHLFLFSFRFVSEKFLLRYVNEFMPVNFQTFPFVELFYLFMIGILALSKRRLSMIEFLLLLGITHFSFVSMRHVFLVVLIATPILACRLDDLVKNPDGTYAGFLSRWNSRSKKINKIADYFFWPLVTLMLVSVLAGAKIVRYEFSKDAMPVIAADFLKQEKIQGNGYNWDAYGDYMIYALWPEYKVFFDGRNDMYGEKKLMDYMAVANVEARWLEVLDRYAIDWVLCPTQAALTTLLISQTGWRLVHADKTAVIFVKDIEQYRRLLEKYPNVRLPPDKNGE